MKMLLLVLGLSLGGLVTAHAQDAVLTLIPPSAPAAPGTVVKIDLLAVNPTLSDAAFPAPESLEGKLTAGAQSWPIVLTAGATAPASLPAGGFTHRVYTFTLPPEPRGPLIVEITRPGSAPLRTAIAVSADAPVNAGAPASPLETAAPALARVKRGFFGRFSPNEPVYFIYGPNAPAAKFQFSFKYRLLTFDDPETPKNTLQFAYTQRSLWDINASSSPFYDTSYMPALFYESLAPANTDKDSFVQWIGWQSGYQHESNGKAGPDSRSLNTLFARTGVVFGSLDGWHLLASPRIWAYVGGLSDNPDLKDYRGYGQWSFTFGKNDGPSLTYTGWAGQEFNHFTTQLDLTIPIRTQSLDFATYLLIQYFDGYGESLLSYDKHSGTVRIGVSLIR